MEVKDSFSLVEIDFNTIHHIWFSQLWVNRQSPIEPLSAISDDLSIDINIFRYQAYYLAVKKEDKIIGVLSGHPTSETSYRLRGLFVFEEYRNQGVGTLLLESQIKNAKKNGMKTVWLLGRVYRAPLYSSLGFEVVRKSEQFEFGPHYLMKKEI